MGSAKKRSIAELDDSHDSQDGSLLYRIRNMWQFANLCQWIYLFGKAVRISDDIDVEMLEMECLRPQSTVLQNIGLALLKFVSSHRGLTPEIFDEYARRQYVTRAPDQNPFGTDETPSVFNEFDIRVLQQLTQWTMIHPTRIREKMEEQRDVDQASWRIEPYGWDKDDNTYFVLDDNRIYRLTEPPPPQTQPRPKKNSRKSYRSGRRSSKRQQVAHPSAEGSPADEAEANEQPEVDDGLGGMKWECIAVTLDEVHQFLQTLQGSRDENEKILRAQVQDHLVPILQQQEESRRRKAAQRERELLNLAKMTNAKRSSRIAGKLEQQKRDEEAREEERRQEDEAAAAQREEDLRRDLEKEREARLMLREARLKDREVRRLRHEEDVAHMSDESKTEGSQRRSSSRQLRQTADTRKQDLVESDDGEDWVFDCECGAYGQVDDGTHSVACERCNVWQHSKCVGVGVEEAERPEFHFICASCHDAESKLRLQAATEPKPDTAGPKPAVQDTPIKPSRHTPEPSALPGIPFGEKGSAPRSATSPKNSDFVRPAGGQLQVVLQSSPSKPPVRDPGIVGPGNPASPEHTQRNINQVRSPLRSPTLSSFGHSPLSASPLFNGGSVPSQASVLSRDKTHIDEPLLPPPSGGISPVKHSQNVPCATPSASRNTGLNLSLTPTLPPTMHPHVPTPPVKVSPPGHVDHVHLDKSNGNSTTEGGS